MVLGLACTREKSKVTMMPRQGQCSLLAPQPRINITKKPLDRRFSGTQDVLAIVVLICCCGIIGMHESRSSKSSDSGFRPHRTGLARRHYEEELRACKLHEKD